MPTIGIGLLVFLVLTLLLLGVFALFGVRPPSRRLHLGAVLTLLPLLAGMIFISYGVSFWISDMAARKTAVSTRGTITSYTRVYVHDEEPSDTPKYIFHYWYEADGVRYTSSFEQSDQHPSQRESVDIYYQPDNPQNVALADAVKNVLFRSLLFGGVWVVVVAWSIIGKYSARAAAKSTHSKPRIPAESGRKKQKRIRRK